MNKYLLIFAISLLASVQAHAERAETVVQQNQIATKSVATASAFLGSGSPSFALDIPAIKIDLDSTTTGIYKTGTVYHLPTPVMASQLSWEHVSGGYVARIKLTANQAKRLRYHLVFKQSIPTIKFRLRGSQDASILDVLDYSAIHNNNVWLPVTEGSQADLEIFVDESTPPDTVFSIDEIAVIVADLSGGNTPDINAKKIFIGGAQKPEKDLTCWSGDLNYPALEKAASATALISFIQNGLSYSCTGTLLSDKNGSNTPWFTTANHCLTNQAIADTAVFKWFYQAAACNSRVTDSRSVTTAGGAQLLWTDEYLESAFLKLNKQPPNGVAFMGWDTDIHANDEIWGVHHPKSDHTMVSHGKVNALLQHVLDLDSWSSHLVNRITYVDGGTEPGSSGSGLFSINNGSAYWKGTLFGGPKDYQVAVYSDFNSYYPMIKQWLGEGNYQSDYQNISWVTHSDTDYCLDITDENWAIYPGFQALQCGKGFGQFSPARYVMDIMRTSLPNGFRFNWRVWSRDAQGKSTYGGAGYEGKIVVTQ